MKQSESKQKPIRGGMVAFNKWLADMGRTAITGYRWRKAGMIHPINICGKLYVTPEEQHRFQKRSEAGEFAQAPKGAVAQHA